MKAIVEKEGIEKYYDEESKKTLFLMLEREKPGMSLHILNFVCLIHQFTNGPICPPMNGYFASFLTKY